MNIITLGYKSKYRKKSLLTSIKSWAKLPANKLEQLFGLTCLFFGAVIALQLAVVATFNLLHWGI